MLVLLHVAQCVSGLFILFIDLISFQRLNAIFLCIHVLILTLCLFCITNLCCYDTGCRKECGGERGKKRRRGGEREEVSGERQEERNKFVSCYGGWKDHNHWLKTRRELMYYPMGKDRIKMGTRELLFQVSVQSIGTIQGRRTFLTPTL